jgi:hypothetical protein
VRLTYRTLFYLTLCVVIAIAWIIRCIVRLPRDINEYRTTPMPVVRKAIAFAWVLTVLVACGLAGVAVHFWEEISAAWR